ncbi:MAG TPA: bacteriocin fulvocin C-related protein [Pyrinomonadaceae bacterium]|nr:bacteriocin fulvocin C-related protein [Pyrinomonadaceae bacterium]
MKKNNLALFTFIYGLICLLTFNAFAQVANFTEVKIDEQKTCSTVPFEMPSIISENSEAFTKFIRVMSLPSGERQHSFSALSNEDKANVIKVKLALQFIKRPNLTREQKGFILDTLSTISADTYDKTDPQKVAQTERNTKILESNALRLFPQNEAYDIFVDMNGDKTPDINFLGKYERILTLTIKERKQAIRASSPIEKSDFWKAQMIYHIAMSKLNQAQIGFIVDIIPYLTPAAFNFPTESNQPKNQATNALDSFEAKAVTLFSKEEIYSIFESPGLQKPMPYQIFPSLVTANAEVFKGISYNLVKDFKPPVNTFNKPVCDCISWCGIGDFSCFTVDCSNSDPTGCGWYGDQRCTKFCKP